MARRKATGLDGLPIEFYLKFWNVIDHDLVAVLNSCLDSGSLSLSQCRGVISLSFKKGDRLDPRNWRPIFLLNVDYKLAARVIAGRLLKVIHLVVDKDQTCGVPGKFIGENVALLHDVVEYASSTGSLIAILSLDQEKAFDRVDWVFHAFHAVCHGFWPILHRLGRSVLFPGPECSKCKWVPFAFLHLVLWCQTRLPFVSTPLCPRV